MDVRNLNLASRPISELFGDNPELLYEMPKFQREYVWDKTEWFKFLKDLTIEDNGHFLGSIIGIEPKSAFENNPRIMVIDGQQRLTTISLYLAALYKHVRFYKANLNEDQTTDLTTLKRRLIQKNPGKLSRVIPQNQNSNFLDYRWLLGEIEVTVEKYEKPEGVEKRKIYKAFNYFYNEIKKIIKEETDKISKLFSLVERTMAAILVVITVKSYSDAFSLFESLNNRGQDLNKTDLLKNIILSRLSDDVQQIDDYSYGKWTTIINNIGDTVSEQERFFRNNYNAFRKELNNGDINYPIAKLATQSNLLDVYADLTKDNPKKLLEDTCENSFLYAQITLRNTNGISTKLFKSLRNLNDAEGSTSFVLLMHIMKYKEILALTEQNIIHIVDQLVKFQIRRNLTKLPSTNKMIPFFSKLVKELDEGTFKGNALVSHVTGALRDFSVSETIFRTALSGKLYDENKVTTTLILKMLALEGMTVESELDLWKCGDSGLPIWTIEHILPQGTLIQEWVDMVANGDNSLASAIQKEYVHTIGNLTITGFNSTLSNKSFAEKRDAKNSDGKYIGYKNKLCINETLCDKNYWNADTIKERTQMMIDKILLMLTF